MAVIIDACLASPFQLDSIEACERILRTWHDVAPDLFPTHGEAREPVRKRLDIAHLEETYADWAIGSWIARRAVPRLRAHVLTMGAKHHATVALSWKLDRAPVDPAQVAGLALALADVVGAHYGMVHLLTDRERDEARAERRPDLMVLSRLTGEAILAAGFTAQLVHGIPSLYWQNLFGQPYVELFGRDRLLAAPVHLAAEHPWGVQLELTASPPDESTWPTFAERRAQLRDYLGAAAFWPIGTAIPAGFPIDHWSFVKQEFPSAG